MDAHHLTTSGAPTKIRAWDYVYLRTAPLDRSKEAIGSGYTWGNVFGGTRFHHLAIQIRHHVYDVARNNDTEEDNNHEYAVYYGPLTVQKWETDRPDYKDKIPIGITFRSDSYIERRASLIWHSIFREDYKLFEGNCQHFLIQLLDVIHATTSQMAHVSTAEFSHLQALPKPLCQSASTTNEMLKRMRNTSAQSSAAPEGRFQFASDADPCCGYDVAVVDQFVREGVSVQDAVAVLQRVGVSFFSARGVGMFRLDPGRLTPEKARLLERALAREIDLDAEGRIL